MGKTNPAWDSVHGAKGRIALAEQDHQGAWRNMMKINDFSRKRSLQALIFNKWAKIDWKALELAQKEFVRENRDELKEWERKVNQGR